MTPKPIPRLVLALLFAVLAWAAVTVPVRAQAPPAGRFAFADTTLLRDTLDLTFGNLFVLAESLRVTPDSLRAWSIRMLTPIERIAWLAESLHVVPDSVQAEMERARYNPLLQTVERLTTFGYSSTYGIGRQNTSWSNTADYNMVRGPIVLRNVTAVRIDRIIEAGGTSSHRSKTSNTELGYKLNDNLSMGARLNLLRSENFRPGSIYNRNNSTNEVQASIRSHRVYREGVESELNLFGGPFDAPNSNPIKSGFGSQYDGSFTYIPGPSLSFSVNSNGSLRMGETHLPTRLEHPMTDYTFTASSSLGLFENLPLSARLGVTIREDRNARPDTITAIDEDSVAVRVDLLNLEPSGTLSGDLALQFRHGNWGVVTVTGRAADNRSQLAVGRDGRFVYEQSRQQDLALDASARYQIAGWSLDGTFNDGKPVSVAPRRAAVELPDTAIIVDYREQAETHARSVLFNASRNLTRRLVFKATGQVSLSSYRFVVPDQSYLDETGGVPVEISNPRDDYRQSYRVEGTYVAPGRSGFTNTLGLDVQRVMSLNLDSEHSGTNREDRIYRVDWRWTYRLLRGLTATQRNQISSTYTRNHYAPQRNKLSMSYLTITTLNATVGPRLNVDLTHSATYRPNGDYVTGADGLDYFNISDSNNDYTLVGHIGYSPASFLTLTLDPYYSSIGREGTFDGKPVPDNTRRTLNFSGGASVNMPVARRGRLSGTINRIAQLSRYTKYTAGIARPEPRASTDYWQGSLQFSWTLQ